MISAAISTLERLVGDGSGNYDREKVISELEQVLSDLNLGLPETTIHTIAEKASRAVYEQLRIRIHGSGKK